MIRPKNTKYEYNGVLYDTAEEVEDEKFREKAEKHIKFTNTRLKTKEEVTNEETLPKL